METGYDILFFWVARMIIMTTYTLKEIPFKTVYLHGLIRDRHGQKMSKSRPETCIDPLEMIKKYGTDAVRLSLVIGSRPGNDMRLYEEKIAGYRNFINKIWNAARFALMNIEKQDLEKEFNPSMINSNADKWILTELQKLIKKVDADMKKFRFSDAGTAIYDFIWKNYCDWYLEVCKGEHKNPPVLLHVLKTTLKLLHPFVPFVTEKLWEFIDNENMLISERWPKFDKKLTFPKEAAIMETIHELIAGIRSIRAELKVEPAKKIHAIIHAKTHVKDLENKREAIMRLARLESLEIKKKGPKISGAKTIFIGNIEVYLPLKDMIDTKKELVRIKQEIEQKIAFIKSLESKLANKGFLSNAPEQVVEQNKQRLETEKQNLSKLQKSSI
jgi:valyl-tRNA synthetase